MEAIDYSFVINLLNAGVRMAIPIVLAAIGCVFAERSGILNINLEGQMLTGAFVSYIVAYLTNNVWLGLLMGVISGMLLSTILAVVAITFRINQTITGIALNMLAAGATSFCFWLLFGVGNTRPIVSKMPPIEIPLLSEIPVLGPIFFDNHSILVCLTYIFIILAYILLFKTTFGLKLRACGEHPRAAETMGVNVISMRYLATLLSGGLAGLGGAALVLVSLGMFTENVTGGRGFVALILIIFGRWHPLTTALAAFFFGTLDAFQLRIQALGFNIPHQFLMMTPYVFSLLTMVFTSKKSIGPANVGNPYVKEQM